MNRNTKLTQKANAKTQPLLSEEQRANDEAGRTFKPDYIARKKRLLAALANKTLTRKQGEVSR